MLRTLFPFHACRRQYPGTAAENLPLLIFSAVTTFPASTDGSACTLPFSRRAQRSLTLRPAWSSSHSMTLCTKGFNHFVTSMIALITSGGSKFRRVGFAPTGKAPPCHGARRTRGISLQTSCLASI